ncbi:MAG: peptidase M61 [Chromatiales bacterium]|nr:peptidase M61 [Chromatiales bacterium]
MDSAAIIYDVRPKHPGAHVFVVMCRVSEPDPDGQEFSLPAWIPGSYMIRDYARHLLSMTASIDGETVPIRKLDKSTWRAGPGKGTLQINAEIYANDLSVRGSFLDHDHAFLNGVCLFFRIHGLDNERCIVHIAPPEHTDDWKLATGLLRLTGEANAFGAFEADGYAELIDRPVLMGPLLFGRFELAGAEHLVAIAGCSNVDMERIEHDVACICASHVEVFADSVPFDRYVFLITALNDGYGGLEHANSTALICKRTDLPCTDDERVGKAYRRFLGLVSHEYFHLWNVKRIQPAEFVSAPLNQEAYTRQLWIFEGITSYYDDLGLLRAGLIEPSTYLELLGRSLTGVYRSGGRRRQTLEESSFDAWIKFYRQDENAPNAIISYYRKGAMVALALDLELRLKTRGAFTLDDAMRALWQKYGVETSQGLPDRAFEQLVEQQSGLDLGEFFNQALRTTIDPPVGILLAQFGVRLHMRTAESDTDAGGTAGAPGREPLPWLGFRTRANGDRLSIKYVTSSGCAAVAGLAAYDELVSLNGSRVTKMNWLKLLERIQADQKVEICVFRHDELRRFIVTAEMSPRDTCYLSLESDVDADVARRRCDWLGT